MNGIFAIINKLVSAVDGLINSISPSLAATIKNTYFFIIFLLAVAAVVIGINMGKGSAKVGGAPIVDSTNDAFKYTVKKEKTEGSFQELIDRDLISEPGIFEHSKKEYRAKEILEPQGDAGTIEPERHVRKKDQPGMNPDDRLAEGKYKPMGGEKTEVKPLDRKLGADKPGFGGDDEDSSKKNIRDMAGPAENKDEIKPSPESIDRNADAKDKKKSRLIKSESRAGSPKPIDREPGAVEK